MTQETKYARILLTTTSVCILLSCLTPAVALAAELPPLPPPPSSSPAQPRPVTGAMIVLQVQFSQTWPWATIPWQNLWTVVQHQRSVGGDWYDVAGWRGGLDDVTISADGKITGQKMWWVAESDLGRGMYRWLVYNGEGGELLATSDPFQLPGVAGGTATVEVSPAP